MRRGWRHWALSRRLKDLRHWRRYGDGVGLEQRAFAAQKAGHVKIVEMKNKEIAYLRAWKENAERVMWENREAINKWRMRQ